MIPSQKARRPAKGHVARCAMCGNPVYIRAVKSKAGQAPAFWHFAEGGLDCDWYTGKNANPDDLRRNQYGGQQESDVHKKLCEAIRDHLALDSRSSDLRCNQKLSAVEDADRWKRPDVYANLGELGRLVDLPNSPEAQFLAKLVPEVFSRTDQAMLRDFDALPEWVRSTA